MKINQRFTRFLHQSDKFLEAGVLATQNTHGKVWLIGGFVYKNLAHLLYDTPPAEGDLDFIIEQPAKLILPPYWKERKNRFGNPKLISLEFSIDYVPLQEVHYIKSNKLEPTIENYLT